MTRAIALGAGATIDLDALVNTRLLIQANSGQIVASDTLFD